MSVEQWNDIVINEVILTVQLEYCKWNVDTSLKIT